MADDSLEYEGRVPDGRRGAPQPYIPPHVPPGTGTLGMWLFLVALFMLFAAVMVAYLVIRLAGHMSPPLHQVQFPKLLWVSTAMVIAVSFTLVRSLNFLKAERQAQFRRWLSISFWLACGFIVVQTPAMIELVREHRRSMQEGLFLYGLVFFLILVHALHVVGGIVALIRTAQMAHRGVYDHEHFQPVRHTVMYWHFLDFVWLVMFFTFLATG